MRSVKGPQLRYQSMFEKCAFTIHRARQALRKQFGQWGKGEAREQPASGLGRLTNGLGKLAISLGKLASGLSRLVSGMRRLASVLSRLVRDEPAPSLLRFHWISL